MSVSAVQKVGKGYFFTILIADMGFGKISIK